MGILRGLLTASMALCMSLAITAPSRADVSPLVALLGGEEEGSISLVSTGEPDACERQGVILQRLDATQSYHEAARLAAQLQCDNASFHAARAYRRICDAQEAGTASGVRDCPRVTASTEWRTYDGRSAGLSAYLPRVTRSVRVASVPTGDRLKTVEAVQQRLSDHRCFRGTVDGRMGPATRQGLELAYSNYGGDRPAIDSRPRTLLQWLRGLRQRRLCAPAVALAKPAEADEEPKARSRTRVQRPKAAAKPKAKRSRTTKRAAPSRKVRRPAAKSKRTRKPTRTVRRRQAKPKRTARPRRTAPRTQRRAAAGNNTRRIPNVSF